MEIPLRAVDDGRSITARVGDDLVVVLEENATTGYRWVPSGAGTVLTVVGDGYLAAPPDHPAAQGDSPDDPVFGRGGLREFRLAATSAGSATLVFVLKHEWEEEDEGLARWSVSVSVAEPPG